MKHMSQKHSQGMRKPLRWAIIIGVAVIAVAAYYFIAVRDNDSDAKTTSKAKTAQSDYSGGRERQTDGQGSGNSQGGATDNHGDATNTPTTEPSKSSSSGAITIKGLVDNSVLASGDTLRGTVSGGVTQVQFRVIDTEVGVIAQGRLNVVDATFSGKLSFSSKSSTGRVDVFSFDAAGMEINNIEIPVQFK